MHELNANEEMIGLAEAAARLHVPYQDAHRLLMTGKLQGQKVRGRWMVRVETVELLESGELRAPRSVTG